MTDTSLKSTKTKPELSYFTPNTLNTGTCMVHYPTKTVTMLYMTEFRYPFAVVGIDLTGEMYSLLKEGVLHTYFYSKCTQWPPPTTYFMETFCEF